MGLHWEIRNSEARIAVTIQHQIFSGKCLSHIIPGFLKSKHYTGIHIQASVLSILCHDRHWPWRNTYLCDTAKCYSTMFIFMYDYSSWWKSIIIIKNKPEPSILHGIVLRLDGFHTRINSLEVVDHIMTGSSLWSLLALTYAENRGGNVSYTGWWKAVYWKMLVLTKLRGLGSCG